MLLALDLLPEQHVGVIITTMGQRGMDWLGRRAMSSPRPGLSPGFGLAELVVVIAMIGILSALAVPAFLSYYQAARLKSGAQQFAALINQAREIAIKENCNAAVALASSQMSYVKSNCQVNGAWVGAGTDAAGNINLPDGITATVTPTGAQPKFNYVGSIDPTSVAVYTLTNTQTNATLTVSVAASGRVTIP